MGSKGELLGLTPKTTIQKNVRLGGVFFRATKTGKKRRAKGSKGEFLDFTAVNYPEKITF